MSDIVINWILFTFSILLGLLPILIERIRYRKENVKDFFRNHIPTFFASLFLTVGCLTRLCLLDKLPGGLNQDEASAGYDAYSIMTYGFDRNGMKYPVHLIAWGSGQNAAYSYFAIPFLKLFSNTEIALRLPMALSGCLSLFVFYYVLKTFQDDFASTSSIFLLVINPWHIMKSRWALESNLFPEMVFLATLLLLATIRKKNYLFFYLSAILFAFSSYSYGTSYFFLFFYILFFLFYFLFKKIFPWYHLFFYLMTVAILCIPIMLFLYINLFDKETIHLLWFDIPKLKTDRFHAVTSIFSKDFFRNGLENWKNNFLLLVTQNDFLPWNSIPYFGTLYLFTIPFSVLGLFHGIIRDRKSLLTNDLSPEDRTASAYLFLIRNWFLVSVMMMFILNGNINRINVVWFPLLLSATLGILDFISFFHELKTRQTIIKSTFALSYLASFLSFSVYYATTWNKEHIKPNFYASFKEALLYSESIEHETTYISSHANYTLVLYYTKYNTKDYIDTVEITNPGSAFENVRSFSGYVFSLPRKLERGNTYIVYNQDSPYSDEILSSYQVTRFQYYSVIDTTVGI